MEPLESNEILEQIKIAAAAYSAKAMADELGKPYSTFSNELRHEGTAKLGLLCALQIIHKSYWSKNQQAKTAAVMALDMLEKSIGRLAYALPPRGPNVHPLFKNIAALSKEFGEAIQALADAIADGRVNHREAQACAKELDDLLAAGLELREYFKQEWRL